MVEEVAAYEQQGRVLVMRAGVSKLCLLVFCFYAFTNGDAEAGQAAATGAMWGAMLAEWEARGKPPAIWAGDLNATGTTVGGRLGVFA